MFGDIFRNFRVLKPFQLKRHFDEEHPTYNNRDNSFFERQSQSAKKSRLDTTGQTAITIRAAVEASYVVSLRNHLRIQFLFDEL